MFITLNIADRDEDEETILIRPEEIIAIERHYSKDKGELGSVIYFRSNSEIIYVIQSQEEVYDLILKDEILKSIEKELTKAR